MSSLGIDELHGGGLVLGYRCPSRCRHCLYACGPHRSPDRTDDAHLDALLDAMAERAPRAAWHIGGGEPFLDVPRLRRVVDGMALRGLHLEYVETNSAWVTDEEQAAGVLDELERVGLCCVLVSVSPFHAEHVPFLRALMLARAARRVLPRGAFLWIAELLEDLRGQEPSRHLDLEAFLAARGDGYARGLAARYGLVAGGRAARYLHAHGQRLPWREAATGAPCRDRLADSSHFHVDTLGRYVPGLCAGIVLPFASLPGTVDLAGRPALRALWEGGPAELVELAAKEAGFSPAPTYSSACDLCQHARRALHRLGGYAELGPDGFYDEASLPGYPG